MDNFAITAADAVSRRYKSNDPEAIIAQRAIAMPATTASLLRSYQIDALTTVHRPIKRNQQAGRQITMK